MGLHIKGFSDVTVQNSEFHDNGGGSKKSSQSPYMYCDDT
jgi:hypothetical protein